MSERQGYFSIIQYSEFPERNEFVNIGIVLFSNMMPRVSIKFSKSSSRVQKAFGVYQGRHFDLLKESFEDRLLSEFRSNWHLSLVDKFIGLRSGKIRLTSPKSVVVSDPEYAIEDLFEKLVEPVRAKEHVEKIGTKLKKELSSLGVENLLEKPKPIPLPQGVVVKAQYAYQNGAYNLISAISLRDEPGKALEIAGKQAIEGAWLSELDDKRRKLIVVGDTEGQQGNFVQAIDEMMQKHRVGFYQLSEVLPLADDIRRNVAKQNFN